MNILFIIKVNILVLITWSCGFPPTMLTIESRFIIIFYTHSPISLNYISFIYQFLEPHLITCRSKTGVRLRWVTELGRSTSLQNRKTTFIWGGNFDLQKHVGGDPRLLYFTLYVFMVVSQGKHNLPTSGQPSVVIYILSISDDQYRMTTAQIKSSPGRHWLSSVWACRQQPLGSTTTSETTL